jgi:hypothetical protein
VEWVELNAGRTMATVSERNTAVLLPTAEPAAEHPKWQPPTPPSTVATLIFAVTLGAFWLGAAAAYIWGYFGPGGLASLPAQVLALAFFAMFGPPALIVISAWAFSRGQALAYAAEAMVDATDRLFSADETASRTAARLGRTVRRELDALNAGLDGAFTRLRALESVLETQIAALDEASARADVRTENVAARLGQERERIDQISGSLADAASRASELVATRLGQERERMDQMSGSLADAASRASDLVAARLGQERERIDQMSGSLVDAASRASEVVATRLGQERERMDQMSGSLADTASRASELVAGRAAQLKSTLESAEGALRSAGNLLETQATNFRAAAQTAAEAPHAAAVELDKQAKQIEQVSDAVMGRTEFLLGRQEKHRAAMQDLVQRLREEGDALETALVQQRHALEQSIGALSGQARVFETMASDTERQLESIMSTGAARATQLTTSFGREADKVKETCDVAAGTLAKLVTSLHDAGAGAQALIGETTSQAKSHAKTLVGDAMAECQKLVNASNELAQQTNTIRAFLVNTVAEIEKHLISLPASAQQEASRVRELVRNETEEILNISARTLSTIHARTSGRIAPRTADAQPEPQPEPEAEGLLGMARKLAHRPAKASPQSMKRGAPKSWQMSALLSAVDSGDGKAKDLKPAAAAALGALEAALADIAIDLDSINIGSAPSDEDWRNYLAGDRTVFARRIASAIDDSAIERISTLNRENARFREAANTYIGEFEGLLDRAREGDNGGLLASTLLSADTGKIYLAVAYALGRLSA